MARAKSELRPCGIASHLSPLTGCLDPEKLATEPRQSAIVAVAIADAALKERCPRRRNISFKVSES